MGIGHDVNAILFANCHALKLHFYVVASALQRSNLRLSGWELSNKIRPFNGRLLRQKAARNDMQFSTFHDLDFLFRQPIQPINQTVDLPIGGFDLALEHFLLLRRLRGLEALMQLQHGLHQPDQFVVRGFLGLNIYVGLTNWKMFYELSTKLIISRSRKRKTRLMLDDISKN
jgi:hypothetical protein